MTDFTELECAAIADLAIFTASESFNDFVDDLLSHLSDIPTCHTEVHLRAAITCLTNLKARAPEEDALANPPEAPEAPEAPVLPEAP